MSYQLYRNTTLGNTLQEALDELMQMKLLTDELAIKVLIQFDKSVILPSTPELRRSLTLKLKTKHLSILRQRVDFNAKRR